MSETSIATLTDEVQAVDVAFQSDAIEAKKSPTPEVVDQLRIAYLGRKGRVSSLMEKMKGVAKEDRPAAGQAVNTLRQKLDKEIEQLKVKAQEWQLEEKLKKAVDISLPVNNVTRRGSLHPVTLMRRVLLKEFRRLGFSVVDGPEVDLDFYNFSALNFQEDHPARDMQDTFFVADRPDTVLRTHTSGTQIHTMLEQQPPLRVVAPGRTYRCDSDLTHTPMFHQIEGLVVDENISMADMKGIVDKFLKAIYGDDLATRLRPSYFPFVEPGGEVDLQCVTCRGKGCRVCSATGWLEVGGLGMVHPNVFEAVDYDSEKYTGFAFGFGIDRLAMLRYGITDLRLMFEGNQTFLSQFPIHP